MTRDHVGRARMGRQLREDALASHPDRVLHPDAQVRLDRGRVEVRCGASRAAIAGSGIGPWRLEPGECAPRFAWRLPTRRLVAPVQGDSCVTEIRPGPP